MRGQLLVWMIAGMAVANACAPSRSGFYDPSTLNYANVSFQASHAPDLRISLFVTVNRTAGVLARVDYTSSSKDDPGVAVLSIYAAPGCAEDSRLYHNTSGMTAGAHTIVQTTVLWPATCGHTVYHVKLAARFPLSGNAVALAPDGDSACFPVPVCCGGSGGTGPCDTSPHSICTTAKRCADTGHQANASAVCPDDTRVCCSMTPPNSSPTSPRDGEDHTTALIIYAILAILTVGVTGVSLYVKAKREHTASTVDAVT